MSGEIIRDDLTSSNTPEKKKNSKWYKRALALVATTATLIAGACSRNTSQMKDSWKRMKKQEKLDRTIEKKQENKENLTLDLVQYEAMRNSLNEKYEDASIKYNNTKDKYEALKAQDPSQKQRLNKLYTSARMTYEYAIQLQTQIDDLDGKLAKGYKKLDAADVEVAGLQARSEEMQRNLNNSKDSLPPKLEVYANRL